MVLGLFMFTFQLSCQLMIFEMVRLVQTKECGNESIDKTKLFNIVILDSIYIKIRLYDWPS